jgi:DHA2 family multidrug resistance protein
MSSVPPAAQAAAPLEGAERMLGAVALAGATFMTVLDVTIANVSIPTIAGDLGVSPTQGTWIITSFTVANAIALPLTGWLTTRFGQVRLMVASILLFTAASWLCALAPTIDSLIACRVLQGLVAGPMVPLSQSLLLTTFTREKAGFALALWSMTALIAPITGPLIGGWITEEATWPWIFYINIPVGLLAAAVIWQIYGRLESVTRKVPVDLVGLALLVLWVGALQVMLDKGKELDWFASGEIVTLACVAVVGFALFLVWELLDNPHPIVDLSLFAVRNFWSATLTLSVGYAVFFASIVILPLWLQTLMGYTQIWAGLMMVPFGLLAMVLAPLVGRGIQRNDPRKIACAGFLIFAVVSFMRAGFDLHADAWTIAVPMFLQGAANVMFFLPLTALALSGLSPERIPEATGLNNFARYTAGAFGASIAVTLWDDRTKLHRAHLAENLTSYDPATGAALATLQGAGFTPQQAIAQLDRMVEAEARMLSTNDLFWMAGVLFIVLAALVWIARPVRVPSAVNRAANPAANMAPSKRRITA